MKFFVVCSIFTFLIHSSFCLTNEDLRESPVACSSDGVACDNTEENLLDQKTEVPTVDMCRDLCLDIEDCQFFSYFDESATQFPGFCKLFKSCETVKNCSHCYTENINCSAKCSLNMDGESSQSLMLTNVGQTSEISIQGWGCNLTLLDFLW